jgi:hypothetical protein
MPEPANAATSILGHPDFEGFETVDDASVTKGGKS